MIADIQAKNESDVAVFLHNLEIYNDTDLEKMADCIKKGRTRPVFDLLTASSTITKNLILATCNYRDFKDIPGLKVENWSDTA